MTRLQGYTPYGRKSKYRSEKICEDGMVFDSKKEARRYRELKLLESAGEISSLERQIKFMLLPEQRASSTQVYKRGKHKGRPKPGKILERECSYIADFVYRDKDGKPVVEDTKGVRTKDYILKRKMMLYFYGIRITEV